MTHYALPTASFALALNARNRLLGFPCLSGDGLQLAALSLHAHLGAVRPFMPLPQARMHLGRALILTLDLLWDQNAGAIPATTETGELLTLDALANMNPSLPADLFIDSARDLLTQAVAAHFATPHTQDEAPPAVTGNLMAVAALLAARLKDLGVTDLIDYLSGLDLGPTFILPARPAA